VPSRRKTSVPFESGRRVIANNRGHDSRQKAEDFCQQIDAERSRGLFREYTKSHSITYADLMVRFLLKEAPKHRSFQMQAYKLEGRIEDSEAHAQVLLERYRATLYESGKPVRSAKFKMRETGSSLLWIHKRLPEVEAIDIEDFIAERLLSVPADAESMPLTLASKLSKAESEFFESRLFEPVCEAARQKQKAVEVREADAIWRLADATHLVLEAAKKAKAA
jgi:hypothetical protein